jgi:predicted lysophospholipase L1 biosynthesis ABC-type transport system permease subunit
MSSRSSDFSGELAGLVTSIVIAVLIIAIYIAVRILRLLVRVFTRYPRNKALWIALGICMFCGLLALLGANSGDQQLAAILESVFGVSFLGLVVTTKAVEMYYDEIFQRQREFGDVIHDVVHPMGWWSDSIQQ